MYASPTPLTSKSEPGPESPLLLIALNLLTVSGVESADDELLTKMSYVTDKVSHKFTTYNNSFMFNFRFSSNHS